MQCIWSIHGKHHPAFYAIIMGQGYWRYKMDNEKFQELVLAEFAKINGNFERIDSRFDLLESQVKENTQILKALEHAAEVNKSEHDRMNFDLANIAKNILETKNVTANNCYEIAYLKLKQTS